MSASYWLTISPRHDVKNIKSEETKSKIGKSRIFIRESDTKYDYTLSYARPNRANKDDRQEEYKCQSPLCSLQFSPSFSKIAQIAIGHLFTESFVLHKGFSIFLKIEKSVRHLVTV